MFFDFIKHFFMPCRCPFCGEVSFSFEPCEECDKRLAECIIGNNVCLKCGHEKINCDCDRINNLFSGIAAPYYNKGVAREGLYRYKFDYYPESCRYFGKKAAETFKQRFPEVMVDTVCFVPSTVRSLKAKYYDYVYLLARVIANELNAPINKSGLKKIKGNARQHDLKLCDRQQNVKGVFKAFGDFTDKTVLLVDDIKTSGYTLSECSKQLRLSGAKEVYAVTVLITANSSCKPSEDNV